MQQAPVLKICMREIFMMFPARENIRYTDMDCHSSGGEFVSSYLKNYTIELTTLAPVFIGSGEQLGKKEYIYNKYEKKAWIFMIEKLCINIF